MYVTCSGSLLTLAHVQTQKYIPDCLRFLSEEHKDAADMADGLDDSDTP